MVDFRVYADATALNGLGRINRLDLLTLFPIPIYVTATVWSEITVDPTKPGVMALRSAAADGILAVVAEGDPAGFHQLDAAESTVLTAAAAANAVALIDERKARALITTDPTLVAGIRQAIGVVGLFLLAKRRGRIPAVRPLLDELIHQEFWVGDNFYESVLRQAGEAAASGTSESP